MGNDREVQSQDGALEDYDITTGQTAQVTTSQTDGNKPALVETKPFATNGDVRRGDRTALKLK